MGRKVRTHFITLNPQNWSAVVDQDSHLIGWVERPEGRYSAGDLLILQEAFSAASTTPRQCARTIANVGRDVSKPHVILQLRKLSGARA